MKTPTLNDRYRFFRAHAGGVVGQSAVQAIQLARSELRAEREGLEFRWEDDSANHYKEDITPGCEVLGCTVFPPEDEDVPNRKRYPLAGLYGIELRSPSFTYGIPRDPYIRVVQAELACEALDRLDEEREAWARAHETSRPDLYNEGRAL